MSRFLISNSYFNYALFPLLCFPYLQTLFVIGIAFQGFFIFAFHCARYTDVRQQWRKTLTPNKAFLSRWRTRPKRIERPMTSQISPQLTQEDLLGSPSPAGSRSGSLPLVGQDENGEGGIAFIDLRPRRNSATEDTHL